MKALLASLAVLLVLSGCAGLNGSFTQETGRFSWLRQASHELRIGESGTCSGTMVAPQHYLTAFHCVDGSAEGELKVNGKVAKVVKVEPSKDLALLYVDIGCPCVPVASDRPAVDSLVATVGYPLGLGQFLTEGRVQPVLNAPDEYAHYMGVTSPVVFGNSGGGVFTLVNGEYVLIGVVSAVAIAPVMGMFPNVVTHLALVVDAPSIAVFLKVKPSE